LKGITPTADVTVHQQVISIESVGRNDEC
jgi:hypothetical protein